MFHESTRLYNNSTKFTYYVWNIKTMPPSIPTYRVDETVTFLMRFYKKRGFTRTAPPKHLLISVVRF